jgi:hypothetical protein
VFDSAWHYRVTASGYDTSVYDADGNDLSEPTLVVDLDANTATVSVDKSVISDVSITDSKVVPVVGSEDYGEYRNVEVDATQWKFGGAKSGAASNAPRVIDLVTPDSVSQSDALAYDGTTLAQLPFTPL